MPRVNRLNANREASLEWARSNRGEFIGRAMAAVGSRIAQYAQVKGTDNIHPELVKATEPEDETPEKKRA